jgi:hypothetical protein
MGRPRGRLFRRAGAATARPLKGYTALAPAINVAITVYNDAGIVKFSKTWTDLAALESDLTTAVPTPA